MIISLWLQRWIFLGDLKIYSSQQVALQCIVNSCRSAIFRREVYWKLEMEHSATILYNYYYFIKKHDNIKTVFCRFSNINVFFSFSFFCIYIHVHFLLLFQMKLCFLIFIFTLPAVQGEVPNTNPNANLPVQYSTVDYRTEFVQATRGTYRGI